MRGDNNPQAMMFMALDFDKWVGPDHPIRPVKKTVDEILESMSELFDKAYSKNGRPSVPPEMLLKGMVLRALFGIPSYQLLVDRIKTDMLFRWFLGLHPNDDVFDRTTYSQNWERLEKYDLVKHFSDAVVERIFEAGLASEDHFTADGSLLQAHASQKSLQPIDQNDDDSDDNAGGGRNADVDFRKQKRSNATHRSSTDAEARLYRKGNGQPALLCHLMHLVTENRNGLIMGVSVTEANGHGEREGALEILDDMAARGIEAKTLGADKAYDIEDFHNALDERQIASHVALKRNGKQNSSTRQVVIDRQNAADYQLSQKKRKLVEECFGWLKEMAQLRRTRLIGRWKILMEVLMGAATYNLVRMRNLSALG